MQVCAGSEDHVAMSEFAKEMDAIKAALQALEPLNDQQRAFAIRMIGERLNVATPEAILGAPAAGNATSLNPAIPGHGVGAAPSQSARQFLTAKRPETDVERISCLAYFLLHFR